MADDDGDIGYSDGSEAYLLRFFEEHAVNEYELFPKDAPWAVRYHLSPRRKTLLSWLDFGPGGGRILELGAGCGALTAHLASLPHQVTAVEGAADRAAVIRARLPNAENLEVVTANAVGLPYDGLFDVVTLVGVLEYAGAFVPGAQPYVRLLAEARRYLTDDGCLILAIENRMGHKYLAGLPEDHTGRPFDGINGYPDRPGVRTFDRPTLDALLKQAGFAATRWFYPSPDYKMPDSIVAETALSRQGFAVLPLLELPSATPDGRVCPNFGERQFLRSALAGGVAGHFMNSFLVLAAPSPEAPLLAANDNVLAVAVNADSCPPLFQTMTRFEERGEGGVAVVRRNLHHLPPAQFAAGRQHIKAVEPYHLGSVSFLEMALDAVEDGDPVGAARLVTDWMELIASRARPATVGGMAGFAAFCRDQLGAGIYDGHANERWLPGSLLDAHPGNVLRHPATGDVRFIDLEWQLACDIPLQLLLDRGVNLVGQKLGAQARYLGLGESGGLPPAMERVLARHPLSRRTDTTSLARFTHWLFAAVTNGSLDHRLPPASR
ncbi:methyltransferase domain-containing protein [Desulfovibrio aerotolerans]|uniref:Methyltransferase domain-containing protein n=1 Tax=Solidesulfovibrio aerotolerans TaxID=295255 RepID=A0A7C9IJW6_9BACT|nr:class I SAM-dependent methyltransferase [Solidesulfovibrio aerotolerans]MYL81746.1 methyltransferase domain-containing protein [Solidesulfovibrio aerotolerans]